MFRANPEIVAFSTGFEFSERSDQIRLAEGVANNYFLMRDRIRSATLPGFNTAVRRDEYFKCGGYTNVLLEDVDFSRRITKLGTVKFFRHIKVMNSSAALR